MKKESREPGDDLRSEYDFSALKPGIRGKYSSADLCIRPSAEGKIGPVPEISRFLGIVIGMFYKDHNPPHFHASYGEHEVAIAIHDGAILWGNLPKRALAHVLEWREGHVAALEEDWERARQHQPLKPIEPLE